MLVHFLESLNILKGKYQLGNNINNFIILMMNIILIVNYKTIILILFIKIVFWGENQCNFQARNGAKFLGAGLQEASFCSEA